MVKVISNVATLYMSFEDLVILLTLFFFQFRYVSQHLNSNFSAIKG